MVGNNREYRTWMGTLQGTKVAVISHGIGGPGLSIITVSTATFYTGQGRKDGFRGYQPDEPRYSDAVTYWSRLGAAAMEMECSLLFIMGRLFNIPTACVTGIIDEWLNSGDIIVEQRDIAIERAIKLVIEYLRSRIFHTME